MKDERVLERTPLMLDRQARERYFEDGFLVVPGYVSASWLDRLRAVVAAKIEESRALSASDDQFDLAPDHSAETPNIRRLRKAKFGWIQMKLTKYPTQILGKIYGGLLKMV